MRITELKNFSFICSEYWVQFINLLIGVLIIEFVNRTFILFLNDFYIFIKNYISGLALNLRLLLTLAAGHYNVKLDFYSF